MHTQTTVTLDHGSGGLASQNLISELFLRYLTSPALHELEDCAVLDEHHGKIALTTDSYVVDPIFFPGGDIGKLAVHGTINDLAMRGAQPIALSLGLIIEEGLSMAHLERIIKSIGEASTAAGVAIVTGDTKVVPKGKADGIFINTSGVGIVSHRCNISGNRAKPGDTVICSGSVADHGITIMSSQAGIAISGDIESDTQPLHRLSAAILEENPCATHVMRDPTRGGIATCLCEIAAASGVEITLDQTKLLIKPSVNAACEMIGLDPLYLANEGKCVVICDPGQADRIIAAMREQPEGREATVIGEVTGTHAQGRVTLLTTIGGKRLLEPLTGEPLPRIC